MSLASVYLNPYNKGSVPLRQDGGDAEEAVLAFHKTLRAYNETPLHSLPELARDLGLGHVFVKDESSRFGLPSFKVLGASWAVYRAVCARLGLVAGPDLTLEKVAKAAAEKGAKSDVRLVSCTEGNWGRAVARLAAELGIPARIFVPGFMIEATRAKIRDEGAEVTAVDGDYDDSVFAAKREVEEHGGILLMDMAWEGYDEIPRVRCSSITLTESSRYVDKN
jgi:diaminopropionate ammonia-lyase